VIQKRPNFFFPEKNMKEENIAEGKHLKNGQQSAKSNPEVMCTSLRLSFCETKFGSNWLQPCKCTTPLQCVLMMHSATKFVDNRAVTV
jgi:hypothetical protein